MAQESKKISFSFAKIIKKPEFKSSVPVEKEKVDYIESIVENSIITVVKEEKKDEELVIPMLGSSSVQNRILDRIQERKNDSKKQSIKQEKLSSEHNDVNGAESISSQFQEQLKCKEEPLITLEEQAAQEIISDLQKKVKVEEKYVNLTIEPTNNVVESVESTMDDYEATPIERYGLAMVRGMGWQEDNGIVQKSKTKFPEILSARPKGLGLGADKVIGKKSSDYAKTNDKEKLKMQKGAYVKISAGKHKNNYGQVECWDDDSIERVVVKLAIKNESISINEALLELVTKDDYMKNSKILNASKYEKLKNKIDNNGVIVSSDEDTKNNGGNRREKSKNRHSSDKLPSKDSAQYYSCSDSSDSDVKTKSRRESRDQVDRDHHRKLKKSRKHRYDNSESSHKASKRDKEREISKDRLKYENSRSSDKQKKHKKHKRSRSRSPHRRR